jgi:hypothetical protein
MRAKMLARILYLALVVALVSSTLSCSVVGLGVGAIIDAKTSHQKQIGAWEMGKVKKGAEVTVFRNDSTSSSGKFDGLLPVPDSEYQEAYSRLLQGMPDSMNLPRLGENIEILHKDKKRNQSVFRGFDYQFRNFKAEQQYNYGFNFQYLFDDKSISKPMKRIFLCDINSVVRSDQMKLTGENLIVLSSNGQLPLRSQVVILTGSGLEKFPLTSIESATVPRSRNAKWIGLGMGLGLDILSIYLTYLLFSHLTFSWGGSGSWG